MLGVGMDAGCEDIGCWDGKGLRCSSRPARGLSTLGERPRGSSAEPALSR